jgi:hypothetical protein
MKDSDGGRGGEGRGGMTRGERRGVRKRDQRLDARIGERRAGALGEVLQPDREAFRDRRSSGGGDGGGREPAPGGVAAAAGQREERPLDPPRRRDHEDHRKGAPVDSVQPFEGRSVQLGEVTEELGQGPDHIGGR